MAAIPGKENSSSRTLALPRVIVATTAMLSFISFWRAAAIVLNDMGSSAFYAGAIAEQAVGRAAPWFILGIMLFAYAVRALYIESCSMFVRGGVYRTVKEALGGTLAKASVSALMFDFILTGPISGVSAGHYLTGFLNDLFRYAGLNLALPENLASAVFAVGVTLYFWWENVKGIPESSGKALRIMYVTTAMVILMILWGAYTLWMRGGSLPPWPAASNLTFSEDALGWLRNSDWPRTVGLLGILIALGHSVLAMSGEETLAQVYREIEHPKLRNLERVGFIIFIYSRRDAAAVFRESHQRAGHEFRGPVFSEAGFPGFCGDRGRADAVRGGEHGHCGLERRPEPRGGGWDPAAMVPAPAQAVWHFASHAEPGDDPTGCDDRAEPGRYFCVGRGVRIWRAVEFCDEQRGRAGIALQAAGEAGIQGSAEFDDPGP
jgi:hypothetical protein